MKHLSKLLKSAVFFTPPPPRFSDKVKYYLINFLPTLVRSFVRSFIRSFIRSFVRSSGLKFLSAFSKNHSFILKLICVGGWITLHGTSCTHLQSHKTQAKQAAATTTPQSKEGGSRGLAGGRSERVTEFVLDHFGIHLNHDQIPKNVWKIIKEWARHENPLIRIKAIGMMSLGDVRGMRMLTSLSQDPEPSVRAAIAKRLLPNSDFSIQLLRHLAQDEEPDVLQEVIRNTAKNHRKITEEIVENNSPEIKMELIERFSRIDLAEDSIRSRDSDRFHPEIIFLVMLSSNDNKRLAQAAQDSFINVISSDRNGKIVNSLFGKSIPKDVDTYEKILYSNILTEALQSNYEFKQNVLHLLSERNDSKIMAAKISAYYSYYNYNPEMQPLFTSLSQDRDFRVRSVIAENLKFTGEFRKNVLLNLAQDQRIDVVQAVIRNDSWWITNAVPVHEILLTIARDQSPEIKMKLINSVSNSDKENIFLALLLKDKDQDIVQAAGEKLIQSLEGLRLPRNSPTQKVIVEKLDPNTELGRNIAKQVIRSSEDGDALYEIKRKFREAGIDF